LRKLLRAQEQEQQDAALKLEGKKEEADSAEEEGPVPSMVRAEAKKIQRNKFNVFQMLEQGDETEDAVPKSSSEQENSLSTPQSTKPKEKKRRKAKDKAKGQESCAHATAEMEQARNKPSQVDEIDCALQELNLRKNLHTAQQGKGQTLQAKDSATPWEKEVSRLLAVNSKHLHPANEIKSLFGSIALERAARDAGRPDEEGRLDLKTLFTSQQNSASNRKELGSLAKRQNILM
jgi:hypothetical protein